MTISRSSSASNNKAPKLSLNSSHPEPKLTAKRRQRKMPDDTNRPLDWIIGDSPDYFKSGAAKQRVRRHAMRSHRWDQRRDAHNAQLPIDVGSASPEIPNFSFIEGDGNSEQHSTAKRTNLEDCCNGAPAVQATIWELPTSSTLAVRSQNPEASLVTGYEGTDHHGQLLMRMLEDYLVPCHQIGNGVYDLSSLLAFQNPKLDAMSLLRSFMQGFATESTVEKWLPAMLWQPHLLLSTTVLASTWLDRQERCSGDSQRTIMVKDETLVMLNERLQNSSTYRDDATLMVVLHLMAGEMWSCEEDRLRAYQEGVASTIAERGGMRALENSVVADVAAAYCYNRDICCEVRQQSVFRAWTPAGLPKLEMAALPESPLFGSGNDFETFANDPCCSKATRCILVDMRDLSDLFIANRMVLASEHSIKQEDGGRATRAILEYNDKARGIRARIFSLPSACSPHLAVSNDFVYEACRIVAIIYAQAIVEQVPFSKVGEFYYFPGSFGSGPTASSANATSQLATRPLIDQLHEALKNTDLANVWNDMAGVLYWVCTVGAAAARTPAPLETGPQLRSGPVQDLRAVWIRRCLIMNAMRTTVVLVSQHPKPLILAQMKLYKIQELIGTHDTK
ncbi:hypothetical protein BDU57DRAFT_528530 [Ampelomyces quisqualis]|uniref:Uncharacterized protein n=1 Tax=Ampelomyces quisqualis TaxID=50730 RepID=A0A6A5QU09_AMPQU|nr:hypothetical protein BDU57DRAFT_528530 [Ampelomyces quisqualis]